MIKCNLLTMHTSLKFLLDWCGSELGFIICYWAKKLSTLLIPEKYLVNTRIRFL